MSPKNLTRNLRNRRRYNRNDMTCWRKSEYRRAWGLICSVYPHSYKIPGMEY